MNPRFRFATDKRKPAVVLRLLCLADQLDTDTLNSMLNNFVEQLDESKRPGLDSTLARMTQGDDPLRELSHAALILHNAIEWRILNDLEERELASDPVDAPQRRWSATLPVTLIDEWEAFVKESTYIRSHLVAAALHSFMHMMDERRGIAVTRYNIARLKAATDYGFREAMAGLGFAPAAVSNDADDDGKAVTL